MIGKSVGHYEITALIGRGGMGEVYRARDTKLGREVAIKTLPEEFARDPDRLARFEREAKLLASLNHANIAAIHGLEESGGARFLVLELVEGETLADRIARGPIPVEESLEIAVQIADALEAAHEKRVIHRDLKPANIKVTPDGNVKVLDFGLAKAFAEEAADASLSNSPTLSMAATQQGVILGTAAYMSPEQAKGRSLDRRTDVFAFGCVLYEMLTGRRAFEGDDVSDTLAAVLRAEANLEALPEATPGRIRQVLKVCLQKDPKRRAGDIHDVRLAMEGAFEARADESRPRTDESRRVGWPGRAVIAAVAALIVAIAAGVGFRIGQVSGTDLPTVTFDVFPPEGWAWRPGNLHPFPQLSPDGRNLVFIAQSGGGVDQLWIRPVDSTTARLLEGTEGVNHRPFWSPGSDEIAFASFDSTQIQLKKFAASGGPPVTLAALTSYVGASWGARDVILIGQTAGPLLRVPAAGGQPEPATELSEGDVETSHRFPHFLPDGQRFTYVAMSDQGPRAFIGTLDSAERRPLPGIVSEAWYSPSGHLLFLRDGILMAQTFDVDRLVLSGQAFPIADQVSSNAFAAAVSVSQEAEVLAYRRGGRGLTQPVWFDSTSRSRSPMPLKPPTRKVSSTGT